MEAEKFFQSLRLDRAKNQDLHCVGLDFTDDAACFEVIGLTDIYQVEVCQNVDEWPPRCTCEDNAWRPELFCKHITLVLRRLGVDDSSLKDFEWEPSQEELYAFLVNATEAIDT